MTASRHSIEDFRTAARRRLPKMVFDYLDGGAGDERGLDRNRASFTSCTLLPRALQDVSTIDMTVRPLGNPWAAPFAVAPIGLLGVLWPGGDAILARAAADAGIPFILSTASTMTVEQVAAACDGELWFQLYVVRRDLAEALTRRALAAGCRTLVLTIDVAVNGERLRDKRSGFGVPFRPSLATLFDCARHPRWTLAQLRHGLPELAHFAAASDDLDAQAALMRREMDASFAWDDLKRLRDMWPGTLLVKGVLRGEDAAHCIALGVDGVILSNHGGRQLEDAPAAMTMLPEAVRTVSAPLFVDGGVRHGGDIVKALAAGASGVLVGRALLYALAADGPAGAARAIAMLKDQVRNVMALAGVARADTLREATLTRSPPQ